MITECSLFSGKPEQGKGLNKKADITLDKVWPVIKSKGGGGSDGGGSGNSSRSSETPSPEKLASMKYVSKNKMFWREFQISSFRYEEKLRRACDKLGARFVEYRPEVSYVMCPNDTRSRPRVQIWLPDGYIQFF